MIVVFEGIDCAGKSTLVESVANRLKRCKEICNTYKIVTLSPHIVKETKSINNVFLDPGYSNRSKFYLQLSLWSIFYEKYLKPILELDHPSIILIDRYYFTTIGYRGDGVGYISSFSENIYFDMFSFLPPPDIIFHLLIPPKIAYIRHLSKNKTIKSDGNYSEFVDKFSVLQKRYIKIFKKFMRRNKGTMYIQLHSELPVDVLASLSYKVIRDMVLLNMVM